MTIQPEALKNVTAAIQSVAITFAVVIGGLWALYVFRSTGVKAKAEAELFEQAVLDISVIAKQEHLPDDESLYVAGIATVVNKGNHNTFLDFRLHPAFRVYHIHFDDPGQGVRESLIEIPADAWYMTLRRGASHQEPIFVRVPQKGFYVIQFYVRPSEEEIRIHEMTAHDSAAKDKIDIAWSGQNYVVVS